MRALLIAILAVLLAFPASAQQPVLDPSDFPPPVILEDPDSTWDDFRREVQSWNLWVVEWVEDAQDMTTPDQQELMYAEAYARLTEHLGRIYSIVREPCYLDYAISYGRYQIWVLGYLGGLFLTTVGPDIEPIEPSTAQVFANVITIFGAETAAARRTVDC